MSKEDRVETAAPTTLEEWRAMFPAPPAQATIDEVVAGLERGRSDGEDSVNHSKFDDDFHIALEKQPTEPVQWLRAAKRLYLANVDAFEKTILTDVSPLSVFTQLTLLKLSVATDSDLSPLSALTHLTHLTLRGGELDSWEFLRRLSSLKELRIMARNSSLNEHIPMPQLPLDHHPQLKKLFWSGNVSDLSCLAEAKSLEELEVHGLVEDLSPLASLRKLRTVQLFANEIKDLSPLFGLESLRVIWARNNRIASLEGIEKMANLVDLQIDYNCISDFSPIGSWYEEDPEDLQEWIEEAQETQLDLSIPEAQAVYDDWLNLDKWKTLADVLEECEHPLAPLIRKRLKNESSRLPLYWARGTMKRDPSWK